MNYYLYSYCCSVPKDSLSMDLKNALYYYNLWVRNSDNYCADIEQFTENIVNFLKMIGSKHSVSNGAIHFKNPYYFTEGLDAHVLKMVETDYLFEDGSDTITVNNSFDVHYGPALILKPFSGESIDRSKSAQQISSAYVHPNLNATVSSNNWAKNVMAKCSKFDPSKSQQIVKFIDKVTNHNAQTGSAQTGSSQTGSVDFQDIFVPNMSTAAYEDMIRKIYHTRHLEKGDPIFSATMAKCINTLGLVKPTVNINANNTSKKVDDENDSSVLVIDDNEAPKEVAKEAVQVAPAESESNNVAEVMLSIAREPKNKTSVVSELPAADKTFKLLLENLPERVEPKTTKLLSAPLSPVQESKPKRGRPKNMVTTPKRALENATGTESKKRK